MRIHTCTRRLRRKGCGPVAFNDRRHMSSLSARTATCSCGQLRIEVTGEPPVVGVCHCFECQRRTGSVFAALARFPKSAVTVEGASTQFVRTGDEGTKMRFRFCPHCGTTLYHTDETPGDTVAIAVGAFADPLFPGPSVSVYEERMHHWVAMPTGIHHIA